MQFDSPQIDEDVTNKYKIHFLNSPAFTNDYKTTCELTDAQKQVKEDVKLFGKISNQKFISCLLQFLFFSSDPQYVISFRYQA